jgi:protein AFG1
VLIFRLCRQSVFAGGKSAYDPALNTRDFVLAGVALDLIKTQGWLLAFDEVQLVDIAGAGLVSRVLSWYWRLGGVVIGSSNRVPDGASPSSHRFFLPLY